MTKQIIKFENQEFNLNWIETNKQYTLRFSMWIKEQQLNNENWQKITKKGG